MSLSSPLRLHPPNGASGPSIPLPLQKPPTNTSIHVPTPKDLRILAGRGSKGFAHLKILLRGIESQLYREEDEWDAFQRRIEEHLSELSTIVASLEGTLQPTTPNADAAQGTETIPSIPSREVEEAREIVEDSIRQLAILFTPLSPTTPHLDKGKQRAVLSPLPDSPSTIFVRGRFWNRPNNRSVPSPQDRPPLVTPRRPPIVGLPTPPESSQASDPLQSSSSQIYTPLGLSSSALSSPYASPEPRGQSRSLPRSSRGSTPPQSSSIIMDRRSLSSGIESLPSTIHTRSPSIPFPRKRARRIQSHASPSRSPSPRLPSPSASERAVAQVLAIGELDIIDVDDDEAAARNATPSPAPSESTVDSNIRGPSILSEQSILSESQGLRFERKGLWPPLGPNTVRGRMSEVTCDSCGGRVHWACAGFSRNDRIAREPWCCPICEEMLETDETPDILPAPPRTRCIRPNCILRHRTMPIVRRPDEDDEYHFDRIIGRKVVRRTVNGLRVFEYLVKWQDPWPLYDSTWEPKKNIPSLEYHEAIFLASCKKHEIYPTCKIALLPEASEWWDDAGDQLRDKLDLLGIEPRTWWDSEVAKRASKRKRH